MAVSLERISFEPTTIKRGSSVGAEMVAQRVREVEISGIRKMFEAAPPTAINLGLGEPDFDPPQVVIDALCEAVREWEESLRTFARVAEAARKGRGALSGS